MSTPNYVAYRKIVVELPQMADGKPTFYIMFQRTEAGDIERSHAMCDAFDAYHLASWLVSSGLVFSAWVAADISGIFVKRETE